MKISLLASQLVARREVRFGMNLIKQGKCDSGGDQIALSVEQQFERCYSCTFFSPSDIWWSESIGINMESSSWSGMVLGCFRDKSI